MAMLAPGKFRARRPSGNHPLSAPQGQRKAMHNRGISRKGRAATLQACNRFCGDAEASVQYAKRGGTCENVSTTQGNQCLS